MSFLNHSVLVSDHDILSAGHKPSYVSLNISNIFFSSTKFVKMALKRPALPDLVKEYRNDISLAVKKFRIEQPQSSKGSRKSDLCQILFYESFELYPIILEGGFKIYPKRWALAFLQHDIKSIAEILCQSLFTEQDLLDRDSSEGEEINLPYTKKIAIQRAAKWLMNKNQDPWSFKPGLFPTAEEKLQIEEAFRTFSWIDPTSAHCLVESENVEIQVQGVSESQLVSNVNEVKAIDCNAPEIVPMNEQQTKNSNSQAVVDAGYEEILQDLTLTCEYWSAFDKAINLGKSGQRTPLGNTAQTAKLLTKMVISDNEDVFVDAVQFSNGRWAAAVNGETVEDIVEPLFRKYYKTEFDRHNIPFKSLNDFSPPKIVALLRAVAWIKKLKSGCWDDSFGFDSNIPEHNLFPTVPEVDRIYNYLSTKYGDGPCRPETCEPRMAQDTPPPTPPAKPETRSTCIVSPTPVVGRQSSPTQAQPTLQSPSGLGIENILGYSFTSTALREALRRFRLDDKNGAEKAGKYLFEEAFTGQEILEQNLSGRNVTEKFSDVKMNAIFHALEEIRGTVSGHGPIPLTKSEIEELTRKIFTEHANYLRRKLKENEAIAARLVASSNKGI